MDKRDSDGFFLNVIINDWSKFVQNLQYAHLTTAQWCQISSLAVMDFVLALFVGQPIPNPLI